ncbi:MAG: ATP-binding protein [Myxococcaceae bacterium]
MAATRQHEPETMFERLDSVRQRPGMYIGGTGLSGLHHMAWEVIGNSIDQHLLGRATTISVDVADGWLTVTDDGAGISIESDSSGVSFLESIFTSLHRTPTRDGPRAHVHVTRTGIGVGLGPVSALSQRLEVESRREGLCHRAAFARGVVVEPLQLVGSSETQGLRLRLFPDPEIFEEATFDPDVFASTIRRFAYLSPGLTWRFQGQDVSKPDGLLTFLTDTSAGPLEPGSLGVFETEVDDIEISFAVALRRRNRRKKVDPITSWVNLTKTEEGGSHVRGLLAGLTDVFGPAWRELEPRLVGAIHLMLVHPKFEGPTKSRLAVPMTEPVVREFVASELSKASDLRVTWMQLLSRLDK